MTPRCRTAASSGSASASRTTATSARGSSAPSPSSCTGTESISPRSAPFSSRSRRTKRARCCARSSPASRAASSLLLQARSNGSRIRCLDVSSATLHTNQGDIAVELYDDDAPKTVDNFLSLARKGFYDGVIFHRVIPDFMIQGGDPTGTGSGGPGYTFEDEFNEHPVARGALAMANAGPNTNGSQFFIVTAESCPWLDGKHTVFGRVTDGMDVVDAISTLDADPRDRPREDVVIQRVDLA